MSALESERSNENNGNGDARMRASLVDEKALHLIQSILGRLKGWQLLHAHNEVRNGALTR